MIKAHKARQSVKGKKTKLALNDSPKQQVMIDLQIKPEKKSKQNRASKKENETVDFTPQVTSQEEQLSHTQTVENSLIGEGLKQTHVTEEEDEVVLFNNTELPHTADNDSRGRLANTIIGTEFEEERPGRDRRKKFDRYGMDSPARSLEDGNNNPRPYGGDSGRFNSLILAKRIKNENSRML